MALPLIWMLGGMGITGYVTSGQLEKAAAKNNMQVPNWGKAIGGIGLLGLLFAPGLVAAIGGGMLLGSIEAHRTSATVREGVAGYLEGKMKELATVPAPAQLPGGATPPVQPGAASPKSIWSLPGALLDSMIPGRS